MNSVLLRCAAAAACASALSWPAHAAGEKTAAPAARSAAEKAGFTFQIEPAPAWIVPVREPERPRVDAAPMHYRVIDDQIRVDGKTRSAYTRVVRVVDETAGLSTASQIELEFDPSYQTLSVHRLAVIRNGKPINKLDRSRIQVLQRETQLERQMYDGRATASIVLDDVRVGDEIDFAYTVHGANPVFDGRFTSSEWMTSYRGPVALYQVRVIAPASRRIEQRFTMKGVEVSTKTVGALRETVFRRESVPQLRFDANAPTSAITGHVVSLAEFADWADVATWGQALFANKAGGSAIDSKAAEIRARGGDRSAQTLAALEFVQKEIRYFGTEIGMGSHRPAAPDKVMEQRFGDCKDKVALLVALLQKLDIPAQPVLVSTYLRSKVADQLPSPLAFDHVIARVELDGTTYWLDATRSTQTGPLASRQSLGLGQGLVLQPGTNKLVALPTPFDSERMRVVDNVRVDSFQADPTLESRVTYRGDLAEMVRGAIAARGPSEMATSIASGYLKIYPKLQSRGAMQVEEVAGDNAITLVQNFSVPEFWKFPEERQLQSDFLQWAVLDALVVPKAETRRDALALQYPGIFRHTIALEFAQDVFTQANSQRFEDGDSHMRLKSTIETSKRRAEYTAEGRLYVDEIAPDEWSAYVAKLSKVLPQLGVRVMISSVPASRLEALGRDVKELETSLVQRKLKPTTQTQREALFRVVVLTAQIDGGRLSPLLEAQARKVRGIQYDHLGRYDEARKDFERALALSADASDIINAAATNALQLRQYDQVVDLTGRVLKDNPRDSEALNTRALARYFSKDIAAAQGDLQEVLKDRSAVRRGYPLVWLSMAMRQSGKDPASLEASYPKEQLPDEWPRALVEMAFGKSTPEALIEAAKASKTPNEALCEAYFYLGEKFYAEGNAARAAEFWRKSVDQGVVEFLEDGASRNRLATVATK